MSAACGYELGRENWQSLLCGKRAVIVVDRRDLGRIYLCKGHATQAAYEHIKEKGYSWSVVTEVAA